ncbi:MAG: nicotinate-nucleotide adenylyltransferase [Lachnospiraceae bacterium]|nr:nicotinate-nucleotide adenylyltransferase [Lachnospiraceae bacterium]
MKIGIMGGTFDPIHIGHLILGENAYQQFELDRVIFMPAGNPPHKKNRRGQATDAQRLSMVYRAVASNPHFEVSEMEMNEEGYSYTYRTLETLRDRYPDNDYFFIIGADSLFDFAKWREPGRIAAACTLIVATRNHTSNEKLDEAIREVRQNFGARIRKLDTENIDVSSHEVRAWVSEGKTVKYYVPDPVIDYINEFKIYRQDEKERG